MFFLKHTIGIVQAKRTGEEIRLISRENTAQGRAGSQTLEVLSCYPRRQASDQGGSKEGCGANEVHPGPEGAQGEKCRSDTGCTQKPKIQKNLAD